jgi:hypothetical protein
MRALLKSWLFRSKNDNIISKTKQALIFLFCFAFSTQPAQIVNYVSNGGFEECGNCVNYAFGPLKAKYWAPIDTLKNTYLLLSKLPPSNQVPLSGYAYQWPKSGNNYIAGLLYYKPNSIQTKRAYPRNTLKQNLQAGVTYCVKFYCSITNQSTFGVDGCGAYFGDSSTDTISQSDKPIAYLTPQVQNPPGNILKDTLNWILITGTFTANGSEKYLILGNFKSDPATNSQLINPTNLPTVGTDVLYDDVSCIALNLPADAGSDYYMVPGDSAFIGRQPDVGINEACTWYLFPNMTNSIANIAGLWVKPANTSTYVVRQDICGMIKWDTVVIYKSAVGLNELRRLSENLQIYPVPAGDQVELKIPDAALYKDFKTMRFYNQLGQTLKEEEINFNDKVLKVNTSEFSNGIYLMNIIGSNNESITKKLVIAR